MGPADQRPPEPEYEFATVAPEQSYVSKRTQECNWLQAMEGGIDSSHISFLHSGQPPLKRATPNHAAPTARNSAASDRALHVKDSSPRFEIVDTEYGLLIGARRETDDEKYYW